MTEQYNVTGMSCAACVTRVEKAVLKVPGVTSCAVNLLTNSMGVEGDASPQSVIRAVQEAGYEASMKNTHSVARTTKEDDILKDRETPVLKMRLIASLCLLLPLMYISMGHMMWKWPLPAFFDDNHVAMGLAQMIPTVLIMVVNQKFFISGFKSLIHLAPNMDTLVAMGSTASFVWSMHVLFAMTRATVDGDNKAVMDYMMNFYFESAAMILTLITIGKMLEARAKGKTTDALKGLMKLAPKTATLVKDGKNIEVPVEQVKKGDCFVVRPGDSIPVDGIVLDGTSAVNEAALTGESIPTDKTAGDVVSAATVNQSGYLKCEATRVGEDTTLSQIIRMVGDAAATKAPIAKIADRVSGVFVPAVIVIAVVTTFVWLALGQDIGFALARGISVLVISCPCALGLATPVAIMVGNGLGARNGILFKTAASLEETGRINIIALDKTGTITRGEPKVTDIIPADDYAKDELLVIAAAAEQHSEHPLAKAIMNEAKTMSLAIPSVTDFKALAGSGVKARMADASIIGGSVKYINELAAMPERLLKQAQTLSEQGKTPLAFLKDEKLAGIIAVADVVKEDAHQAVRELQDMDIRVVMLTGDNRRTAAAIGTETGVDEVIAEVLPDGKEQAIRKLGQKGKTAMVGDGINDAPALSRADIGIAIGAGTDIAVDAADVVLMQNRLCDVPAAIRLSRATLRNIRENLFWAFIYNIIGIPLAAGLFIPVFGWTLNPMFGAAAMSLSSFCVVVNALRLNLFKPRDADRDHGKKGKRPADEKTNAALSHASAADTSEVCLKIEGMMCEHCEARVKKVLEDINGVVSAAVSFKNGTAVVKTDGKVSRETMKRVIDDQGYTVL